MIERWTLTSEQAIAMSEREIRGSDFGIIGFDKHINSDPNLMRIGDGIAEIGQ